MRGIGLPGPPGEPGPPGAFDESTPVNSITFYDPELGPGEPVTIQFLNGVPEVFSDTIGVDNLVRASVMQAALNEFLHPDSPGPTLPSTATRIGELFLRTGATSPGMYVAGDLVGDWNGPLDVGGGGSQDFVSGTFGFETYYGGGAAPTGLDITKVYYEAGKSWYWDSVNNVWQALFIEDVALKKWATFSGDKFYVTSDEVIPASVTKAELSAAVNDGNVYFVGDALNGTLGATTPASVAATTGEFSGVLTLNGGSVVFGNNASSFPAMSISRFNNQLQFNTGTNGFIVNNAANNANLLLLSNTGALTAFANGAASTPPVLLTGTWFTGGTATTTKPQLLIEPTGITSTNWSTLGTAIGANAASGFTGNLLDLGLAASSKFKVAYDGTTTIAGNTTGNAFQSLLFYASSGATLGLTNFGGPVAITATNNPIVLIPGSGAAAIVQQRNGTNAQTYELYGTYTDPSNYRRLRFGSTTAGAFSITAEGLGTGASGNTLSFGQSIGLTDSSDNYLLSPNNSNCWLGNSAVNPATGFCSRNANSHVLLRGWYLMAGASSSNGDVSLSRNAAGVWQMGTTSNNALGSLLLTNLTASGTVNIGQSAKFTEQTYTPTGTTQTIDLNSGNLNTLSLGSTTGDITLTLTVPTSAASGRIKIIQHGTTARNITIALSSLTAKWFSAIPTWSSQATGKHTILTYTRDGSFMNFSAVEEA